jgi:hypothetical protein
MTTTKNLSTPLRDPEALEARFALAVAARLNERAEKTPHDISERLRVARELALARAREARQVTQAQVAPAALAMGGGTLALSGGGRAGAPWWWKLASFVPLVVLLVGLHGIDRLHARNQLVAAAEVDTALLADTLPPEAYRDPGFVEFLKTAED